MIVDLFAGAGGWDIAARSLDLDPIGIELDAWACKTRAAAGLQTIRQDVRTLTLRHGSVEGLIASPPCPQFSVANNNRRGLESPEGRLTLEPLRLIHEARPRWIAMEQVPAVLSIWRGVYANDLLKIGYNYWAGTLNAADYGVPQTRNRAILIASLDKEVREPKATHAGRWVSMSDALGWGLTMPCPTIPGTSSSGGPKGIDGGSGARKAIRAAIDRGDWRGEGGTSAANIAPSDLGVLQSFPAAHPWQGTKSTQCKQIGNAIPPLLAWAVLKEAT